MSRPGERTEKTAVLVDEHPLWLDTIEHVVTDVHVVVVGKFTRSTAALQLIAEQPPDLLITGVRMPEGEMDGIALVRETRQRHPSMRAIVLSMYDDQGHVDAAFAAGASTYVLKSAHPDDLRLAIRQAFSPSVFFPSDFSGGPQEPVKKPAVDCGLTRREHEILQLVAEGYSNAQLAKMLWVTEQTVKFHLSNIYKKLDVANRTEASRWAQVHGLLTTGQVS